MNVKAHGKRLLSTLLAASMLLSCSVFASAASDIDGHWAQKEMQSFIDKDLMQGFGDGVYSPDGSMTRAQLATLINRITDLSTQADLSAYKDVKPGDWYYADLAKAVAAGYMNGTSATTMSPNDTVTREQAVTMLARLLGLKATSADLAALEQYSDLAQVDSWAKDPFAAIVAAGYVQGTTATTLSPLTYLTRAQGVTILSRAMSALEDLAPSAPGDTLKDGTYTGTGAGYGGTITVQMTVSGGKITKLEVTKHSETASYLRRAQSILDNIVNKQTTEGVDTVSGATKTSRGLLTAVNACISQAKGGADTSTTGSTGSGGGGAGNSTPTVGEDFLGTLKDGTYTGSARGYSGMVKVTVKVENGKITAITIDSHGDTTSYFNRSKAVIQKVIDAQSTDVDVVSGATYSSYGILNAINDALKEAVPSTEKTYKVSTWKEFTTALAKAVDGDTIELTADITDAGESWQDVKKDDGSSCESFEDAISSATPGMATVNKAVTIDGKSHTISTSADKGMAYCFNIGGEGVVMKDLTIDGASYGKRMGGGLYLAGSRNSTATPTLTLDNVTIKNCISYKTSMPGNGGGAIYCKGAVNLTATNCTFDSNVVKVGLGGAILAQNANVTLTGCTFTGNTAPYGGAIAATGTANLSVTNCKFTVADKADNNATYGGDDIYIFDGKTPGKQGNFSDSVVSYALSGNTYSTDGETWKDYALVMGRFLITNDPTTDKNDKVTYKDYLGSGVPFAAANGHDLTFKTWERTELASEDKTEYQYLLMNIPYDAFYAAELTNDVKVDGVSSATKNKTRTGGLVAGSYHVNADGTDITGITFPVLVDKKVDLSKYTQVKDSDSVTITVTNRGTTTSTTYTGKDALFEKPSYAYYVLDEAPAYFKVLTAEDGKLSFGKVQGITTALKGVKAALQTDTTYGDYQINLVDDSKTINNESTIYGVILQTKEGSSYALRHLENVWRGTELAFCTGFTSAVHNCPTDSDHYRAIMGQTVEQITYLMDTGIYTVSTELYIPVKFAHTFSVANADCGAGTTAVTMTGFPEDYAAQYTVTNAAGEEMTGFSCDGKALTWTGTPANGIYTLTVSDSSGKYSPYSVNFQLQVSAVPAQYDADTLSLVKAGDASDEALQAYLDAITSVSVNGKSYSATGRGATVIINENGFVDLTAAPFAGMKAGSTYEIVVTATGYSTKLTFTLEIPDMLYGTATLTYQQFYSGDVSDTAGFDAVSSATTSKYATFKNTNYKLTYEGDTLTGYTTSGVKNVNVAVSPADLAGAAEKVSFTGFTTVAPAQYKTVQADGTLSATTFAVKATVSDASAELVTGGVWGDYQINVVENADAAVKYLRNNRSDEGWAVNSYIQGIILETDEGLKVGTAHMENIWVQPWEVAWDASGQANSAQLSKLIGEKVTKITYIMPDGAYVYTFADGIYIKPQYAPATAITGVFSDGMTAVTLSAQPEGLDDPTLTVGYKVGRKTVYLLQDAPIGTELTFTLDPSVTAELGEGGTYSVTIKSGSHANYAVAIPMTEAQKTALQALIAQADELLAKGDDAHLKSHRDEAAALLAEKDATSADAAALIAELQELTKS